MSLPSDIQALYLHALQKQAEAKAAKDILFNSLPEDVQQELWYNRRHAALHPDYRNIKEFFTSHA
jgi:hypothetical protein